MMGGAGIFRKPRDESGGTPDLPLFLSQARRLTYPVI
jgi:hypothetical protein